MKDTKEIIKCPACGAEMKKVSIKEKGFNVDICTEGCGGIFFDNREFEHFDEEHEDISEIEQALEGKAFKKQDESKIRICPACNSEMVKNYASSLKEIEIDECYNCGGKFLDGDELQKIRAQFKTEDDRKTKFNEDFVSVHGQPLQGKCTSLYSTIANAFYESKNDFLERKRQEILNKVKQTSD